MRTQYGVWALTLALVGTATAATVPTADTSRRASPTEPCAIARAAAEDYLQQNDPDATSAVIRPSLALACLLSIPVDTTRDLELLDYLKPYVEWQSTLETLAKPPEGYLIPGVDILAGLGHIRAKLNKGEYDSQAEFASDLAYLFIQAADGHFYYSPAIFKVFSFSASRGVLSISTDGLELPKIYDQEDVLTSGKQGWEPSEIVSINGQPIVTYLGILAARQGAQDPDAKYNTLFNNVASQTVGAGNFFIYGRYAGIRDEETIVFANGTTINMTNWATISVAEMEGLGSAEQFHETFEVPSTTTKAPPSATSSVPDDTKVKARKVKGGITGYPPPVEKHEHDWIAGYFLNETGYEDVAVLAILGFLPFDIPSSQLDGMEELHEAQRAVRDFLVAAKKAGKTKLVIDVSANGGGFILAGFDIYRQLFPKADVWDANRIRSTETLDALGDTAWDTPVFTDFIGTKFDRNGDDWPSWDKLYGPQNVEGQLTTNLLRYDFADEDMDQGYFVTGFDPKHPPAFSKPPFAPENIVVVTDGYCASTCTIFTGLLAREQGVRTITLGGRPLEAPMQAMGGVKGAQVLEFSELRSVVAKVIQDAFEKNITARLEQAVDSLPSLLEPPLLPPLSGAYNYRNAYTRDAPDGHSVQFVYEASNCRIFYTLEMIRNPEAVWVRAADSAWFGAKCAPGSTVNSDDTIGEKTLPYDEKVMSDVPVYDGPGSLIYTGESQESSKSSRLAKRVTLEEKLHNGADLEYKPTLRVGITLEEKLHNAADVEYKPGLRVGGSLEEVLEAAQDSEYKPKPKIGKV